MLRISLEYATRYLGLKKIFKIALGRGYAFRSALSLIIWLKPPEYVLTFMSSYIAQYLSKAVFVIIEPPIEEMLNGYVEWVLTCDLVNHSEPGGDFEITASHSYPQSPGSPCGEPR